jgi:ATP-dependent DNA helicase RecG
MIDLNNLKDLSLLRESHDLECKLALGRDGQGAVPEDFWPTYSAFANTNGGVVVLGVRDRSGSFQVEGIPNVAKVRQDLFNALNNRQKVSINLLSETDVVERELEGRTTLIITVPRATRAQRPVYLTSNPFAGHTFRRLNEGDRALPDEEVKRMLAEQVEDSRDTRILTGYDFEDLDMETFRAYRQVFASRDPSHPWTALENLEFLRQLGGWRRDRETGQSGLTVAGLLMFGQAVSIQEEFPNYMLDYQERAEARAASRWVDRITLDGKWSGNLYDFYRRVYLKLTADLKVPFRLEQGERKDETPVHEALREALANVIVHADYSDRASVLVVKRPDMFGFRNPGLMRIPAEIARKGGESDCRNRTLHKMFRLVGVGEQAGSGIPKILQDWSSQHWSPPKLYEVAEPYNQTLLELRMIDLFPKWVLELLRDVYGARFDSLDHAERVALALAAAEGTVTHARLRAVSQGHPVDLSKTLQYLVQERFLASTGGRGAVYHLHGFVPPTADEVFGPVKQHYLDLRSQDSAPSSPDSTPRSPDFPPSSPDPGKIEPPNTPRDANGCFVSYALGLPIVDDLEALTPAFRSALESLATLPRQKKAVERTVLMDVLLKLCARQYITLRCLAALVSRNPESLRDSYLTGLVKEKKLELAFPTTPNHERQAYCAAGALKHSPSS